MPDQIGIELISKFNLVKYSDLDSVKWTFCAHFIVKVREVKLCRHHLSARVRVCVHTCEFVRACLKHVVPFFCGLQL